MREDPIAILRLITPDNPGQVLFGSFERIRGAYSVRPVRRYYACPAGNSGFKFHFGDDLLGSEYAPKGSEISGYALKASELNCSPFAAGQFVIADWHIQLTLNETGRQAWCWLSCSQACRESPCWMTKVPTTPL
jgi:hypothetical protein